MADALVFGGSPRLVSKLADGLSDVLGVRVRYQHSPAENVGTGVAICTSAQAFASPAPILVYADDEKPKGDTVDPNRVAALGRLAEAVGAGRPVTIISSKAEARRWVDFLRDAGVPQARPLRKMNISGQPGSGKTTLANRLSPALGLPVASMDALLWGHADDDNGRSGRAERVEDLLRRERWLTDGTTWREAAQMSANADVTIHLDFSENVLRERRALRGDQPRPLAQRVVSKVVRSRLSPFHEFRLGRRHSEIAHLGPIFDIHNDQELETVTEGLLRGAAVAADAPGGTA